MVMGSFCFYSVVGSYFLTWSRNKILKGTNMKCSNSKRLRIFIFYLIAILFSFYFRFLSPEWYNQLLFPYGLSMIKDWLSGLGPFLGALVVLWIFKPERRNTLFGTSKLKSVIMAVIPLFIFTIIGANNNENINIHLYGFNLGITITVYCILEETGWRGYLQDELRNINPVLQYLIIGFLWYTWHLTFLSGHINLINELIIFLILFAASVGIGFAVKYTQSIIVAACMHMIGNIIAFSSLLKQSISVQNRLIIAGICIFTWIIILIFWDKKILNQKK
ncbi:CPBP family intramembrane metalloprotease [candidate division KSB1 bacterium]|nr:CPBP family intramembrane metalloprotease [candidate division KSB1 bacterium]